MIDPQTTRFLDATENYYRTAKFLGLRYTEAYDILKAELDKAKSERYSSFDAIEIARKHILGYDDRPTTVHEATRHLRKRWNEFLVTFVRELFDLEHLAYPDYECLNCLGHREAGCYCQAMGGDKPGGGPVPLWRRLLRKMLKRRA